MILYHASSKQGLHFLDPRQNKSTHLKSLKMYIYASDDKSYASGFSFEWSSKDGIRFGQYGDDEPWVLEIPKKHLYRLNRKCSIYFVNSDEFRKVYGVNTPEFYSKEAVAIYREEKYKSALECMKKNNVKIKVI